MRRWTLAITFLLAFNTFEMDAQTFAKALFAEYDTYLEESLKHRRFKHADIMAIVDQMKQNDNFKVEKLGESVESRDIYGISYGHGDLKVLMWSQMHGNEPTATMALMDIFNFLSAKSDNFDQLRSSIKQNLSLHFIPMLNPDGADRYQRRNAMHVDLNRDALNLEFPESQILKQAVDNLQPRFGFNLHDQNNYYNVGRTPNTAAISYLAPAYNYEKEVNKVRREAMQLIVAMNETVQQFLPGHVGRYKDDFEPRAFGDNIQKWGTSTILVEAGGIRGDQEKQFNRKIHFCMLLSALAALADESFQQKNPDDYFKIPENNSKMADLILRNVSMPGPNGLRQIDIAFKREEIQNDDATDFYFKSSIDDIGDLSTYFGYQELDASDYDFYPALVYNKELNNIAELKELDLEDLLSQGISEFIYPRMSRDDFDIKSLPINVHKSRNEVDSELIPEKNPSFFLSKNGRLEYGVINGHVIKVQSE